VPPAAPSWCGSFLGVDVLVNNLGIFEPQPFPEISDADWLRFFETNVLSGIWLSRHYLPGMREKDWGRIVFVSSESAVQIPVEMIHYGMTKTAQIAVARGLAESLAETGVCEQRVARPHRLLRQRPAFVDHSAARDAGRGRVHDCVRL
jgi:NAD(P)-dependent dehydrogenase (short-subunit alcohol dehydrogenase family)